MNYRASIKNQRKQMGQAYMHLQSFITALEDIVFELDGNKVFKKVWVKDESALFMPIEKFMGKTVDEVMGNMADLFSSAIDDAIKSGEPREVTYKHIDPKINNWYKLRIKPVIITTRPEDSLLILIIEDITVMKQNELALIDARKRAEKELKSKSDFLSVMSHEVRTPLNGIIGIANLLKLNHTKEQAEYIDSLLFSAGHLMELVNNILDYTKIENDKLELEYTEVLLSDLVTNIANQFKVVAENKGLKFKKSIDQKLPAVHADPVRLAQMLNNLISNSLKFTSDGSIRIRMKVLNLHTETISIRFSVKDTGMGIPDALKETVFESFIQGRRPDYSVESGTGLGLAITQKLAALHNSRVFLISHVGKGSEFYFDVTFNLVKIQDIAVARDHAIKQKRVFRKEEGLKNLKGMRVLVVDDNPINIMVACKQLMHYGAIVDTADNGNQALQMVQNHTFDAALVDLHMPDMDGYELSFKMRSMDPHLHIIIFTADIMADIKIRLAKIGVYDILSKPFDPEKLYQILHKN